MFVHFDPDEIHAEACCGDGARSESEERIQHQTCALGAMEPHALFGNLWRERRGMRAVPITALNRFIRDEPRIAPASKPAAGLGPPLDVRRVLIRHANRAAIQAVPAGAADEDDALKSLVEGVSMTEREFLNVLERHGVKRLSPKGEAFNPHQHQAMMEMQNPDVAPGTILEVFQPGYVIEDRVLRPAMVIVAKGGAKAAKPQASEAASSEGDAPGASDSDAPPAGNDNLA